ncbi:MAG: hypothetical protein KY428_09355, partial [Bacteroidetes bacterium]|nr:hypothetical protein [Bacteroidota bacterium]
MAKIAYTGLAESSHAALHQLLGSVGGDEFIEVAEDHAKERLAELASFADVYLIGERVGNPIKLAQTAQGLDNLLSVLIFNDVQHYQKIKQALLFTPFISNAVKSLPNAEMQRLMTATREAITRTQQRRSYVQLKSAAFAQQSQHHAYEAVRSEYLDKFLDEAPIGAVLMTEKGLILAVNRQATKILNI